MVLKPEGEAKKEGENPELADYGVLLDGAGWSSVPHQQRPSMLLPIPGVFYTPIILDFLLDPLSKSEFFYP